MQTVFHVSTPEDVRVVVAKVRNLLADETVAMDSIAVVLDSGAAIAQLHADADAAAGPADTDSEDDTDGPADLTDELRDLLAEGVALKACSNAARHSAVSRSDLLEGVEVVSSGVGELTRLQDAGYAYIRL